MQEHFRGKIIRRMLGEIKYREFAKEYNRFKAYGVYKQVFEDPFVDGSIITTLRRKFFDF